MPNPLADGISAVVFASSLGIGVAFSAAAVFLYQGAIALMASFISPFLGEAVIEMTCVGSRLTIAGVEYGITKINRTVLSRILAHLFVAGRR